MRFASTEHVGAFRERKEFPKIHDDLFHMIVHESHGRNFVDLGCCYGLLGERLLRHKGATPWHGLGVESNPRFIQDAMNAGVTLPITCFHATAQNIEVLGSIIRGFKPAVTVLIARRVLPELFGDSPGDGKRFAKMIAAAGIRDVFIQGRTPTIAAVNGLDTVEKEVALFAGLYTVSRMEKQCAHLVRK